MKKLDWDCFFDKLKLWQQIALALILLSLLSFVGIAFFVDLIADVLKNGINLESIENSFESMRLWTIFLSVIPILWGGYWIIHIFRDVFDEAFAEDRVRLLIGLLVGIAGTIMYTISFF